MGSSFGLMGERGAEAILPLSRGPNGQLGIAAQSARAPVSVTVNISAADADSFRKSEAQITSALARAVARGQRSL
jgi:phage-related minor tail protein